jgi:hypothetical protein
VPFEPANGFCVIAGWPPGMTLDNAGFGGLPIGGLSFCDVLGIARWPSGLMLDNASLGGFPVGGLLFCDILGIAGCFVAVNGWLL